MMWELEQKSHNEQARRSWFEITKLIIEARIAHYALLLHPSLDIYPAFFYYTALSLIRYAGASCDRQAERHHSGKTTPAGVT